jgi:hypothetical protein
MRVHLPALLALATATTYVACGASDPDKTAREGGAGGEGGEVENAGGSQAKGGSQNSAGSSNNPVGGAGGDVGEGGMLSGGGAEPGTAGMAGAMDGSSGAGGEGTNPYDSGFPTECGSIDGYTPLEGTMDPDTMMGTQFDGQVLAHGLEGDDTFIIGYDGSDCVVGGPGDDDFSATGEVTSYLIGGSGADTFHVKGSSTSSNIVDFVPTDGDVIGLSVTYGPLVGATVGEPPPSTHFGSVPDYEAGTGTAPGTGAAIVYDPATGKLWLDYNGGTINDGSEQTIAVIMNYASYTFDENDFIVDP